MQLITYVIYSGLLTYNSLKYLGVNGVYALRLRLHRQTLDTTSYYIPVAIVCSMGKFLLESLVSNRSRADPLIFPSMCFQSCLLLSPMLSCQLKTPQGCRRLTAARPPPAALPSYFGGRWRLLLGHRAAWRARRTTRRSSALPRWNHIHLL